jgi:hypothetical protein
VRDCREACAGEAEGGEVVRIVCAVESVRCEVSGGGVRDWRWRVRGGGSGG